MCWTAGGCAYAQYVRTHTFVCACAHTSQCASLCVGVCNPTSGNAICISYHTALASVLRYLHVDLISMVTREKRAARQQMRGGKRRHPDTNRLAAKQEDTPAERDRQMNTLHKKKKHIGLMLHHSQVDLL